MYPVSSVTSDATASSGATESVDGSNSEGGTIQGSDLQQVEFSSFPTSNTAVIATSERVSTKTVDEVYAEDFGASIVVSSPVITVDSDVLGSLGVVLSPDSVRVIEGIFLKVDAFAELTYVSMVGTQLLSSVSNELTVTGRAIWYFTYRMMCEDSFVSSCLDEYHSRHRPGFIHALPSIQVLSNSPDRGVVPLSGDSLSDFLSRLDCAVRNRVKSIFDSCWGKVSVALEKETLDALSCKDFIKVLEVAGIPPLASSAMSEAMVYARSRVRIKSKNRAISEGTGKCTASRTSVTDIAHSSGSQLLPSQSHTELSAHMHSQSELRLGTQLCSVGDCGGESYSDHIAAKRHKSSDSVTVSTCTETGVVSSIVRIPPVSSESNILTSSVIFSPSSCVLLSVQCVDLLGVKLHPDSAELIRSIFREVRMSARGSFSQSMADYISTIASSELSAIGKVIWFKTYKELHLSRFMCKLVCVYHYKCYPNFVRALGSVRVLSNSSDPMLVPLSGVGLLDFLSKLDCAIREEVSSIFNLEWDRVADKVFAGLEDGSFGDVSCDDFIDVLNVVGIHLVEFSIYQRRVARKKKTLGSGSSECTVDVTESRSISMLGEGCDQSSSNQPGGLSAVGAVSTVVIPPGGTKSFLLVTVTTPTTLATTGREVDARSIGGISAQKYGTYTVVSSSAATVIHSSAISSLQLEPELLSRPESKLLPRPRLQSEMRSSQKPAAPDCDSLCAMVLPECALMIKDLFSEVRAFARSVYEDVISKQLPPGISNKLSVTGRAIWYWTYTKMCEANLVFRCLGEYHAKHRPGFVRSLSKIKVLLDSEVSLLDFLLALDCAISRETKSIFSSCWNEVSVSLEEESLGAISCGDFVRVLNVAGIPEVVLSANVESYGVGIKGRGAVPVTSVVGLAHSFSPSSQLSPSQQCVDLLGVKLHPDSAKLIYDLFFVIRKSAKMSCSMVLNCLLRAMSSELSVVGKAVWCRTYRELHLLNFMAKFFCLYHSRYRHNFIHSLADIRVLSSSHDRSLVPLSGDVLLGFLSKLDCAIIDQAESVFNSEWDEGAKKVLVALKDGSLADVNCDDLVNVLDVAGIPKVASLISTKYGKYQRFLMNKSKTLGIDSKRRAGGTRSVPREPGMDLNLYGIHFRKILPKPNPGASDQRDSISATGNVSNQPASVSVTDTVTAAVPLPGGKGSSLPVVTEFVAVSDQPASVSVTDTVTAAVPLPGGNGSSLPVVTEFVAVSDQPASVSVTDTVSTVAVSPGDTGSSLPVIEPVSVPDVYEDYFLTVGEDVVVSTEDASAVIDVDELPIEEPSSLLVPSSSPTPFSPLYESRAASDISSASPLAGEAIVRSTSVDVTPAFWWLEDESFSPPSSPSIAPSSLSLSSFLSPSGSGLDADVSSSSTDSLELSREVGLTSEVIVSESEVLVDESTPASSSGHLIVPITAPSPVSASMSKSSMATSSSSSSYFYGPKKAFIMQLAKEPFEIPASNDVIAGPSSSAPVVVANIPPVAAATDSGDVGVRLAALLNRGLPPSPPPVDEPSESMRGGRVGVSSSHRGSAQRGRGRKRKS
ncbi:hypothetical protein [Candidatus Ichthyocystis sparus]|uniref:hypothetical protein n=1 Tax=Candidatus Ichthyocystis sparus TaxID=1561004 RepID=UPI000A8E586D|nr:hypothetical protein [Candidatus Ichthyocystis sparus]